MPKIEPCVYFVRARQTGYIKIGYTSNLLERFRHIQAESGDILELLVHVNGATRTHERTLHRKFEHARLYAEWFRPDPDLLATIETLRAGMPPETLRTFDACKHALYV